MLAHMLLKALTDTGASQCEPSRTRIMQNYIIDFVCGFYAAGQLKRLQSSGPAAQQFLAEVSRILEEGTARQETNQEMSGKIAHAASVTNLPSLSSHPNSGKHHILGRHIVSVQAVRLHVFAT